MNIKIIGNNILIKVDKVEIETSGGIVLPPSATDKPITGIVVGVGSGWVTVDGKRVPLEVKKGDHIIFKNVNMRDEIEIDEEKYLVLEEGQVVGVLGGE